MASLGPQRTREMILAATSTACLMGWAEVCSRHASPVRVISPPRPMAFQFIHVFPNAWQPFCLMTMIAPFSGQAGFCACCSVTHSRAYQAVRVKARSCHFFCGKAATQGKPYLSLRRLFDLSWLVAIHAAWGWMPTTLSSSFSHFQVSSKPSVTLLAAYLLQLGPRCIADVFEAQFGRAFAAAFATCAALTRTGCLGLNRSEMLKVLVSQAGVFTLILITSTCISILSFFVEQLVWPSH